VLARPPTTRRAIPAAANAGRVVVNGDWYKTSTIRLMQLRPSEALRCGVGDFSHSGERAMAA
jgi:hypothetical protein